MFQFVDAAFKIKEKFVGTSLERALEDSTSLDDNLNIPTRLLAEISDKSFNQEDFEVIMKFIWLQLLSPPEKWRKTLKTLNLINFLLKNGSPRFVGDIRDEIYQIRILHRFSYQEGSEDKGAAIREISKQLDQLLNDDQLLEQERRKADSVRDKLKNLQSLSSAAAENSKANRYEGFSSDDVGKFVKTIEGSSPDSKVSEPSPKKENDDADVDDFVIRQNTKYHVDLTKEEVPEPKTEAKKVEPTTTELLDLLDMSSPVAEQKTVTENIPKQETIWNWDQPTYNKSASQNNNNTQDFDWGNAPQANSGNDTNVLANVYNRSQSTPMEAKASPFDWDQVPVSQGSTNNSEIKSPEKEDFDVFQSAVVHNNGLGGKNFSESEKAIIDLSQMGTEVKATKVNDKGGFLYSTQEDIDDLFTTITIQNNMTSNPQMNQNMYGNGNLNAMKPNMYGYAQNNMGNFGNSQAGFGGRI